jgi:hypothetical protein
MIRMIESVQDGTKVGLLNYLIEALEDANRPELDNTLDMRDWVESFGVSNHGEAHFCNSVACVCGYVSLSYMPLDSSSGELSDDSGGVASYIAEILGSKLEKVITKTNAGLRRMDAIEMHWFTDEELEHPHLTTEPSIEVAISFLELLRSKIK